MERQVSLMRYCSLHHHSTFSFMDGFGTPEKHVLRAVELGMPALALTDHGNISGHIQLEKAATKHGIKPIFGCELYTGGVDDDTKSKFKWHLTVLAENAVGYQNLVRLVTAGWASGNFYYEPTVSGAMLAEHSEGLIVLSGCSGSKFVCDLLGGKGVEPHDADFAAALRTAAAFKKLLGDRYYLEAQAFPTLERTRLANSAIVEISRQLKIPVVATGDVHYTKPDESDMQVLLHAVGRGKNTWEQQSQSWGYDVKLSPPTSDRIMVQRLVGTGMGRSWAERAVQLAGELADRCTVELPKMDRLRFPVPAGTDSAVALLRRWTREGWRYRGIHRLLKADRDRYAERVKYELGLIEQKDFCDYFLMLSDVVSTVKNDGVPVGPARGSAAASLVCFLLRITEVDPMKFPLMLFERFIDINRMDLPDVDLDFDDELRYKVQEHLVMRYGEDHVGQIGTFTKYKGKNSLDDVARAYRIPPWALAPIKERLVERSGGDSRFDSSLEDTIGMFPQAQEVVDAHPELKAAMRLEGNYRGMGVHAAGLVVGNAPLTDYVATYTKAGPGGTRIKSGISADKYDAEHLNVLKIDALGLSNMGLIRHALEIAGLTLDDLYAIDVNDPAVIARFKENDVVGIFQFDGRATRSVCGPVSPDNFQEICDVNALSRPGPLFSGQTEAYINIKHGKQQLEPLHPIVDRLTAPTKGQIVYQEQILQIMREYGGFPWADVGKVRRIISKKLGEVAFVEMEQQFIDGGRKIGADPELSRRIWKLIITSGTYSFNIAHAVSYSMLAFWTMWLKMYHPIAFYTAAFRKFTDDKLLDIQRDARKHGIHVLPPDVDSGITWEPAGAEAIKAGWSQIPGIGPKMAEAIMADIAERGPIAEWPDLIRIKGFGPKKLDMVLEWVNTPDPFGLDRVHRMLAAVRAALAAGELGELPKPTVTAEEVPFDGGLGRVVWLGIVKNRNLRDLFEDHRSRSGEELDPNTVRDPELKESCTLHAMDDTDTFGVRINRWNYPRLKEAIWNIKLDETVVLAVGRNPPGTTSRYMHASSIYLFEE